MGLPSREAQSLSDAKNDLMGLILCMALSVTPLTVTVKPADAQQDRSSV